MLRAGSVDPVEDIPCSVGSKQYEVERVNDSRDSRLAQEQQLGQDTDRF